MKRKIAFLAFSLALVLGCSSDNGSNIPPETPVPPTAGFSANETTVEEGSTVSFTDDSQNAGTYAWSFDGGDPTSSTTKNQEVVYNAAGVYTVSLKVTNADGEDTETKIDYITVTEGSQAPMAVFTA
ncbi:MAG: PKD domain-containing protein, partial [Aurantibacter sp.]